jgi:aldose 1-epimerase
MSCDGAPGGLEIIESLFGKQGGVDGISVHRYDCSNGRVRVSLLDFGATLFSVQVPDRDGKIEEVTLNVTSLDQLLHKNMYFGSTVGRVANRVANGRFTLDGKVRRSSK